MIDGLKPNMSPEKVSCWSDSDDEENEKSNA